MSAQRFESQSYYEMPVVDMRLDPLSVFDPEKVGTVEYEFRFTDVPLPLGYRNPKDGPDAVPKRAKGFVNGLTQLEYGGLDGELNSGFVELLQVDTPAGEQAGVIHSYSFRHSDGLPYTDTSWYCQFDSTEAAREVWHRYWNRHFVFATMEDALGAFFADNSEIDQQSVRLIPLGLLKPWFQQKPGDYPLLDNYATDGNQFVRDRGGLQTEVGLTPGLVYRTPKSDGWYLEAGERHELKTCVTAFSMKDSASAWLREDRRDRTVVQWHDGTLASYTIGQQGESYPVAATAHDFAKPKQAK